MHQLKHAPQYSADALPKWKRISTGFLIAWLLLSPTGLVFANVQPLTTDKTANLGGTIEAGRDFIASAGAFINQGYASSPVIWLPAYWAGGNCQASCRPKVCIHAAVLSFKLPFIFTLFSAMR